MSSSIGAGCAPENPHFAKHLWIDVGLSAIQARVNQPTAPFKVIALTVLLHHDTCPSVTGHDGGVAFCSWP